MLTYEFWKEVTERVEEGDITEDILLQLGVLVSSMMWWWEVGRSCRRLGGERICGKLKI